MSRPVAVAEKARRAVVLAARRWVKWYEGPPGGEPALDISSMESARDGLLAAVHELLRAEKSDASGRSQAAARGLDLAARRRVPKNPALPTMKRVMGGKPRRKRRKK